MKPSPGKPEPKNTHSHGFLHIWVVTSGKAGMENPCLGLAQALVEPAPGQITIKRIALRSPWRQLVPFVRWGLRWGIASHSDAIYPLPAAHWPDIVISSGRQSVAVALLIKKRAPKRPFLIHILNPQIATHHFDYIIIPRHDKNLRGTNIIRTQGSLHHLSSQKLAKAQSAMPVDLQNLRSPVWVILLGGPNSFYHMPESYMEQQAQRLAQAARQHGAHILFTPSRRSPAPITEIYRKSFVGIPYDIWDGEGENPYLYYLARGDYFFVTQDSVNMVSEATFTGKPVYILPLVGKSQKFDRFHEHMQKAGMTRFFTDRVDTWQYAPLDETRQVAAFLRDKI